MIWNMSDSRTFQVNYLLAISRLPDHFYGVLHGYDERDSMYKNPGVSLRSFVIAKCIRKEAVTLQGDILRSALECEQFSTDAYTLSRIVGSLSESVSALCNRIAILPEEHYENFQPYRRLLSDFYQATKMSFDVFILSQDPSKNQADIMSMGGSNLKTAMFDLQEGLDEVTAHLESIGA